MVIGEFALVKTPYETDAKGYSVTECPFHKKIDDKYPVMVGSWACSECDRLYTMNDDNVVCKTR